MLFGRWLDESVGQVVETTDEAVTNARFSGHQVLVDVLLDLVWYTDCLKTGSASVEEQREAVVVLTRCTQRIERLSQEATADDPGWLSYVARVRAVQLVVADRVAALDRLVALSGRGGSDLDVRRQNE